jgi:hypothetical protein
MIRYQKSMLPLSLAISISVFSASLAAAAPGDVNSINDGRDIQAGTYLNTPGSRTTFINSGGGSMWLHSGDLVRGLETNNGALTGNGGHLYFRNPNNVIRSDGNIDVSAVRNGTLYTGNGGSVDIDCRYLFQNGNIWANGANGGLVQFNVGGMTLGSNAQISAQGFGGNGGHISINSTGTVDLRSGSVVDSSGKVAGTFDTNVINIEGSAINNQAVVRANGIAVSDLKPDNGDSAVMAANPALANNPVPSPVTFGNGTHDTATMQNIQFATPGSADFRGGTIRLVATGQTNSTTSVINAADSQMMSDAEKSALNSRNNQIVQFNEGDVLTRGALIADGGLSKNGGTIILAAARHVSNGATIRANGADGLDGVFDVNGNGGSAGNGGTIVMSASGNINNTGTIQANGGRGARAQSQSLSTANGKDANVTITSVGGTGGQGGMIAFNYGGTMSSSSTIQANGGIGGNGGHANTYDTEVANAGNPNPVANSTAVGGKGGTGGQGGLIVFSGSANPTGNGSLQANGGQGGTGGNAWADSLASSNIGVPTANSTATSGAGGTGGAAGNVMAPVAATFASGQNLSSKAGGAGNTGTANFRKITVQNGVTTTTTGNTPVTVGSAVTGSNQAVIETRRNEYLRHDDVAMLFSQAGGQGTSNTTLTARLNDSRIRTVANVTGTPGSGNAALIDAGSASSIVISSGENGLALTTDVVNSNTSPVFFNLNNLTIMNNGNLTNNTFWTPGVHLVGAGFHDMTFALGGGNISWLSTGDITNNQIVVTRGLWSGGSTQVAAQRDVINNSDFISIAPFKDLLSGFSVAGPRYESSHAGNLTLKAGRDIVNNSSGKMETNLIFFDIHPPLNQNPPIDWPKFLNGAQIGATVNLLAGRNINNSGIIGADALTFRNGALGAANPALTMGGIVIGRARTGTVTNTGTISANGNAFFTPDESASARFQTNTFPATTSFNGTVDVH